MKFIILVALALMAFAANSVLARYALASGQIGPGAFGALRLLAGAVMLAAMLVFRGQARGALAQVNPASALALLVYIVGFSFAYVSLETGTGALILFGGVQVTMFAGALWAGERPPLNRWFGAGLGLLGLIVLFGPEASKPDFSGAFLMILAAIGWGIYTLMGKSITAPTKATAANFILATPFALLLWWLLPSTTPIMMGGILAAVASGALASGLGYALWYAVLPKLKPTEAAILQLTVPILALLGGIVFVGESFSWGFGVAAALVLAGVMLGLTRSK